MSKKYLKTNSNLAKGFLLRLTPQNRKIVETEAKNLNVSINNFVNYLVSLFDSVNDNGINATIKKEVLKWIITPLF